MFDFHPLKIPMNQKTYFFYPLHETFVDITSDNNRKTVDKEKEELCLPYRGGKIRNTKTNLTGVDEVPTRY